MSNAPFSFEHPCGLTINQALKIEQVKVIPGVEIRDMKTGYWWVRLPPGFIADSWIFCGLSFKGNQLGLVSLSARDSDRTGTWADWSEEAEHKCVEDTRQWLRKIGFPVGEYSWGSAFADYDPKGASGGGGVCFKDASGRFL
jgi:hypothetical protein